MPPHSSSKSLVVALKGKLRTKMDLCGGRRLRQRGEAASLGQRLTHAEPSDEVDRGEMRLLLFYILDERSQVDTRNRKKTQRK